MSSDKLIFLIFQNLKKIILSQILIEYFLSEIWNYHLFKNIQFLYFSVILFLNLLRKKDGYNEAIVIFYKWSKIMKICVGFLVQKTNGIILCFLTRNIAAFYNQKINFSSRIRRIYESEYKKLHLKSYKQFNEKAK